MPSPPPPQPHPQPQPQPQPQPERRPADGSVRQGNDGGSSAARRRPDSGSPLELPEDVCTQVRALWVLRADPDEREALLSIGQPFFAPRAGRDRIGVQLTGDTDWEKIRERVIDSYRILAPKKLTALLGRDSDAPAIRCAGGS